MGTPSKRVAWDPVSPPRPTIHMAKEVLNSPQTVPLACPSSWSALWKTLLVFQENERTQSLQGHALSKVCSAEDGEHREESGLIKGMVLMPNFCLA